MTKEQEEIEKAISNVLRGNDIESASCIVEKVVLDNYRLVTGRINVFKIATRQLLDYAKESKGKVVLDYAKENVNLKEQLKEKDAEIEKYKKLLADNLVKGLNNSLQAKQKADTDLDDLNKGWQVELEKYKQLYNKALDDAVITAHDNMKKDKMIDLYIDELETNEFDRCCQECCRECEKDKDTLRTCIKQYFERKVKNEL